MSLFRFIFYSAVIAGWAAFFGWLIAEWMFFRSPLDGGLSIVIFVGGIVGGAIGTGLSLVSGLVGSGKSQLVVRLLLGLLGGAVGGAAGAAIGNFLFWSGLPRAFGWVIVGLGVGVIDGCFEKSKSKIRNGMIGGAVGGLIGGLVFDPIRSWGISGSGMSSRATAFVILGLCIGAFIGLTHVILKEAWLSVIEGYRPGRQLILSLQMTGLGRSDQSPLPFIEASNQELDAEHCRILRQSDGSFAIEDCGSKLGTKVNEQRLAAPQRLRDGDMIQIGRNLVRFNERKRSSDAATSVVLPAATTVPPPPPSRRSTAAPAGLEAKPSGAKAASSTPAPTAAAPAIVSPKKVAGNPTTPNRQSTPAPGPPPPPPPPRRPKA